MKTGISITGTIDSMSMITDKYSVWSGENSVWGYSIRQSFLQLRKKRTAPFSPGIQKKVNWILKSQMEYESEHRRNRLTGMHLNGE